MSFLFLLPVTLAAAMLALAAAAITFGTRKRPAPLPALMHAIERLAAMRFPPARRFAARDGAQLAYREYPVAGATQVAVLLHGSIHDSRTMHSVGVLLAMQGVAAYALDVRGHGGSGRRGDIDYVGQLEDDLADFVAGLRVRHPDARLALVGHSAGGGFTLRFAGSERGHLFDRYVSVAPFLHHSGEMVRKEAIEWAVACVPRFTALAYLHSLRVPLLQRLPVLLCAVPANGDCTASYSFRLALNFRPNLDWQADVRAIRAKTTVLIGEADELFKAEAYGRLFQGLNEQVQVQVLKAVDHTSICMKGSAVMAIRKALA
jgi:alpha-beta hydrolase superfamily lysophospholipase